MQQLVRTWLEPLTTQLREAAWSMPLGQGLHLLGASLLVGAAVLLYPRLAKPRGEESPGEVLQRLLPWIWIGLGVLATTGFVLFSAEPVRMMRSPVFQAKMAMLLLVIALTLFLRRARQDGPDLRALLPTLAGLSLALWIAIAASGRLIGYGRRLIGYFFG